MLIEFIRYLIIYSMLMMIESIFILHLSRYIKIHHMYFAAFIFKFQYVLSFSVAICQHWHEIKLKVKKW
jgi:hypothetical protein